MSTPDVLLYHVTPSQEALDHLTQTLERLKLVPLFLTHNQMNQTLSDCLAETPQVGEYPMAGSQDHNRPEQTPGLIVFNLVERERLLEAHQQLFENLPLSPRPYAVGVTETNRNWILTNLLDHVAEEKRYMDLFFGIQEQLEVLEELEANTYTESSWKNWQNARETAFETLRQDPKPSYEALIQTARMLQQAFSNLVTAAPQN